MRPMALVFALYASAASATAQTAPDTTVTIQGFVQRNADSGTWTIVVPLALELGRHRTFVLPIEGKSGRWSRFVDRYVEATGRVSLAEPIRLGIGVEAMREVEAPGTSHRIFDRGLTIHAEITLAAIPRRFAWRDERGAPTGVNPMLLYTVTNRRQAPIRFVVHRNQMLCVTITSLDGTMQWDLATEARYPSAQRLFLQRGGSYREGVHLPVEAAPKQGRYMARATLCAAPEYEITTEFEVR